MKSETPYHQENGHTPDMHASLKALSIVNAGSQAVCADLVKRGCSGLSFDEKYKVAGVFEILAQPGDRDVINLLKKIVKAGGFATQQALRALVKVTPQNDEDVVDFLMKYLVQCDSSDWNLSESATWKVSWALGAIARKGNQSVIDFLMERLDSKDWWVRGYAAMGLGDVANGDQAVIDRLLKLNGQERVKHLAGDAVGKQTVLKNRNKR